MIVEKYYIPVADYLKMNAEICNKYGANKSVKFLRSVLDEIPNDFYLLKALMDSLPSADEGNLDKHKANIWEAITIGKSIIKACYDKDLVTQTKHSLVYLCTLNDRKEDVIEMIKNLSNNLSSQENHNNYDFPPYCDNNISNILSTKLAKHPYNIDPLSPLDYRVKVAERIKINNKLKKLYEEASKDRVYDIYNTKLSFNHMILVNQSIKAGDFDKALEYLEESVEYAIAYDTLAGKKPLEIVNKQPCGNYKFTAHPLHNNCWQLLNQWLPKNIYNPIRHRKDFKALEKNLMEYAK